MSQKLQYTVEWGIKPGGLDTFKSLANQAIDLVQANEPGMIGYQWYFNDDESKCYTVEWFNGSEAFMAHLQNVGGILPKILEVSDITRFEVFGNPSEEARTALAGLGASIVGYYGGFTR